MFICDVTQKKSITCLTNSRSTWQIPQKSPYLALAPLVKCDAPGMTLFPHRFFVAGPRAVRNNGCRPHRQGTRSGGDASYGQGETTLNFVCAGFRDAG